MWSQRGRINLAVTHALGDGTDHSQVATNRDDIEPQTYAGHPNGNVTPRRVGDDCIDTNTDQGYRAKTTADTSWEPLP